MSASRFQIVDVNPNDTTGGGGCVCSEVKLPHCEGPFAVFYAQSLETVQSPHVVACARCIADAHAALEKHQGEVVNAEVVDEDDVPLI